MADLPGGSRRAAPFGRLTIAALVLGAGLRLAFLGFESLNADEAWTFNVVISGASVAETTGADPHPLSFYWLWRCMGPLICRADWLFRLPSALCSIAALLLWWRCISGLRLDRTTAFWCVFTYAVLPASIRFAASARAYALTELAAMSVLYTYWSYRARPTTPRGVALLLTVALSCHIDGLGLVVPGALGIFVLSQSLWARAARPPAAFITIGGLIAIPYYLWRLAMLKSNYHMMGVGQESLLLKHTRILVELSPFTISPQHVPAVLPAEAVIHALAAIVVLVLIVGVVAPPRHVRPDVRNVFVAIVLVPPIVLTLVFAALGDGQVTKRYLFVTASGLVPLLVFGLRRLGWAATVLLCAVVPASVLGVHALREKTGAREVYALMTPWMSPGDGFLVPRYRNWPLYSIGPIRAYAWMAGRPITVADCCEYSLDESTSPNARSRPPTATPDASNQTAIDFARSRRRIWIVLSDESKALDLSSFGSRIIHLTADNFSVEQWELPGEADSAGAPGAGHP